MRSSITKLTLVTTSVLVASCGFAFGEAMPMTANIIQVQATSGGHTATFQEVFQVNSWTGNLVWGLQAPLSLTDGSVTLATISDLNVAFNADPQVDLNFALINSSMTDPCMFSISAATIAFTPILNAQAGASASVTLTQGAGSPAGGSITGQFPNGKMYQARYSTTAPLNTHTVFASLAPSMSFPVGLGMSETETLPAFGMSNLGVTAYMMESQFSFVLSAGDQATGSSAFLITPEPASLVLIVIGGVGLLRRR